MQPNLDTTITQILEDLLAQMRMILGDKLVGLYLYGSLVTGDFDSTNSDIDLLAALASDLNAVEFATLQAMHDMLVVKYPHWEHRLEIAYLSTGALKTFRTKTSPIAVISPGEPFHFKEAGHDWLVNWYVVREKGLTLFGPLPSVIIDPIATDEFIQVVKSHIAQWGDWLTDDASRPFQAYAILTMCRALYSCTHGEQVSKLRATQWTMELLPEYGDLIQNALNWRQAWREEVPDSTLTLPETRRFVEFMQNRILS